MRVGPSGGAGVALWLVLVALVGWFGFRLARRAWLRGDTVTEVAAVGLLACLLSPVAWIHHFHWIVVAILAIPRGRPTAGSPAAGGGAGDHGVVRLPAAVVGDQLDRARLAAHPRGPDFAECRPWLALWCLGSAREPGQADAVAGGCAGQVNWASRANRQNTDGPGIADAAGGGPSATTGGSGRQRRQGRSNAARGPGDPVDVPAYRSGRRT